PDRVVRAAAVLRGGRGSQHHGAPPNVRSLVCSGRPPGRPRIATSRPGHTGAWAAEQRPSSGAAEDRNDWWGTGTRSRRPAAAVLRGGRGSQPGQAEQDRDRPGGSGRPPGGPGVATVTWRSVHRSRRRAAAVLRGGRGSQRL